MRKAGKEEGKKKKERRQRRRKTAARAEGRRTFRRVLVISHQLSHRVVDHVSMCWRGCIVGRRRKKRKAGALYCSSGTSCTLFLKASLAASDRPSPLVSTLHTSTHKRWRSNGVERTAREEGADRARAPLSWLSARRRCCCLPSVCTGGARAFPRRP